MLHYSSGQAVYSFDLSLDNLGRGQKHLAYSRKELSSRPHGEDMFLKLKSLHWFVRMARLGDHVPLLFWTGGVFV